MIPRIAAIAAALWMAAAASPGPAAEVLGPVSQRFADPNVREVPDFQRHILPLMGRLGCNTRSCHGSFQGQGGFRLSLFGYDFQMDHEALLREGSGRVDVEAPEVSKILEKPTLTIPHKGGRRMEQESWPYRLFYRWIEDGARGVTNPSHFERLEVIPGEIVFRQEGQHVPLKVIAHWADGTREDVTCISRFRTNDESIAAVSEDGVVTSLGRGDTHVVAFYDNGVAVTQVLRPVSDSIGPNYPDVPTPTPIDELVVAKLRKLGIIPSEVCSDAEFLRRVSLDMTGTLPTPPEVEAFLADPSPSKREQKVDELLSRPTYAARWTTKLCDITGNTPRNFQGQGTSVPFTRDWYNWIYARVQQNTPYDELVAGIVLATSRRPGQSYDDFVREQGSYYRAEDPADFAARETMPYYWARRNLRKPEEKAQNFSYAFLGVRLECAQCHKHPFDQWTQEDFNQFTAFFNGIRYGTAPDARQRFQQIQEELGLKGKNNNEAQKVLTGLIRDGQTVPWQEVFLTRPNRPAARRDKATKVRPVKALGRVITPKVLGGEEVNLASDQDPREPLMNWMRDADNPYFARALINRVWAEYFGSGIVDPPDDMNLANPPSNAPLLDYLAGEFVRRGFDMKWLHREIATSQTYQRSWQANASNALDERNFSRAVVRRLPAEVVLDAVAQATAGAAHLARATTDLEARAIGPNFGAGRRGGADYAANVFGRSNREANCDCSRSDEPNLLQSIFLQNDQQLLGSIIRSDGWLAERTGTAVKAQGRQANARRGQDLAQQVAKLQRRLQEKKGTAQAERLEARLNDLRAELQAQRKAAPARAAPPPTPIEVEPVVVEAYLRTLSRRPTAEELEVAGTYFAESASPAQGLRDLLWALLNTKEFITNH